MDTIDLSNFKQFFQGDGGGGNGGSLLADFLPSMVYVYDTGTGKLTYINKRVTDLLGYTYDDIASWDHDFSKLIFKEDQDLVKEEIRKFTELKDNEDLFFQNRFGRKEGDWRYFRTKGTVLRRNENGVAKSLLFVAEDITDSLTTQAELESVKRIYQDTEKLLGFGNFQWEIQSDEFRWSKGLSNLLGYDHEKAREKMSFTAFANHIHKEDFERFQKGLLKAIENRSSFDTQVRITSNDGEEIIVSINGNVIFDEDDKHVKTIGAVRDITLQVGSERELVTYRERSIEREKFLQSGSWEMDMQTKEIYWSEGMYRLFGYDPDTAKTQIKVDLDLYKQHMMNGDFEQSARIRQGLYGSLVNEYKWHFEIITAENERRNIESFGRVIRDAEEKPLRIIGISRDVTQISSIQESLEEKIVELNRSNKELEEFAYVASHDLQEPLRKLSTFTERLVNRYAGDLGPEGKMYTDRILAASNNMRLLIDNLLDFSRLARMNEPHDEVNLNDVLSKSLADQELLIEQAGIKIKSDKLPVIEGIESQLRQLFNNLVNNAVKFRSLERDSVIEISSRTLSAAELQDLGLKGTTRWYEIIISDNGIGFEQEFAEQIFKMFQRLHGKVEFPGTGVGLAICKRIVENHKGRMFAEAIEGEGAKFIMYLPEHSNAVTAN